MKKLLILGSDFGTIDIATTAKSLGYYVITADLMESSPTKNISDEKWLVSTADIDTLEIMCREAKVDGIIAGASDFNNEKSKLLSIRLGLNTPYTSELAEIAGNNKRVFKDLCIQCGVPVAKDYYLTPETEIGACDITYPVVVKPVDLSGNRGMSYCSNDSELAAAIELAQEASANPCLIVEKELHGPEYAVHYIVINGEPQLLYFASEHNQPGYKNNMYSLVTTTSSHLKQYLREVDPGIREVFKKAGCTNGIAWLECIRDSDSHFYCFEMGYRFGATMLYSNYAKISGFDAVAYMICHALNDKYINNFKLIPQYKEAQSSSYHLFMNGDGYVSEIIGLEEIERLKNVTIDIPRRKNRQVHKGMHFGILRIYSVSTEQLIDTIKQINQVLRVNDCHGNDLLIHYTDYNSLKEESEIGKIQFAEIYAD